MPFVLIRAVGCIFHKYKYHVFDVFRANDLLHFVHIDVGGCSCCLGFTAISDATGVTLSVVVVDMTGSLGLQGICSSCNFIITTWPICAPCTCPEGSGNSGLDLVYV